MKIVMKKITAILLAVLMIAASFAAIAQEMEIAPDVQPADGTSEIYSNRSIVKAVGAAPVAGPLGASGGSGGTHDVVASYAYDASSSGGTSTNDHYHIIGMFVGQDGNLYLVNELQKNSNTQPLDTATIHCGISSDVIDVEGYPVYDKVTVKINDATKDYTGPNGVMLINLGKYDVKKLNQTFTMDVDSPANGWDIKGLTVEITVKYDIVKKVNNADSYTATIGEELTYTITASNGGDLPLTCDVTDTVPEGIEILSVDRENPRYDADGNLILGENVTLAERNGTKTYTVTAKVEPQVSGSLVNTAQITSEYLITKKDTATVNVEAVTVEASKVWVDNDDSNKYRPASINLQLKQDGGVIETIELSDSNNWAYTWDKLPTGHTYTVDEAEVTTGDLKAYTKSINDYVITNTLPMVSVTATKTWEEGVTPTDSVTLKLMKGESEIGEATIDAASKWTHTWQNLPKTEKDGTSIAYKVIEVVPEGFEATYDPATDIDGNVTVAIQNNLKRCDVVAYKHWEDAVSPEIRPVITSDTAKALLTISPAVSGIAPEITSLENDDNTWKYTWKKVPLDEYTVSESSAPTGYDLTKTETIEGETHITNTAKTTSVTGQKIWADESNKYNTRPAVGSFALVLYADGEEVTTVTPVENEGTAEAPSDTWTYTWTGLPAYTLVSGEVKPIIYTVDEPTVTGYTKSNAAPVGAGENYTITNTMDVDDFVATKIWDDADNVNGLRPETLALTLMADGKEFANASEPVVTVDQNDPNKWIYTWSDLPTMYTYSVEERVVPAPYTSEVAEDGKTVTNTLETIDISVEKKWTNDIESKRPEGVTFNLSANVTLPERISSSVTVTAEGNWKDATTWVNLPKTLDGKTPIVYTVVEAPVAGYILADKQEVVDDTTGNIAYTFTNNYLTSFTLDKVVTGNMGDINKKFAFDVTYTTIGEDGVATEVTEKKELSSTDSVLKFENVVSGTEITVTETKVDGYKTYAEGMGVEKKETATITIPADKVKAPAEGETNLITFTNNKTADVDTGIILDSLPYVLILLAVAAVVVLGVVRKRRNHD